MDGSVKMSLDAGILILSISNPATANSLTPLVLEEIDSGLRRAQTSEVRVVVVTGEGDNFCSGGDMHYLGLDDEDAGISYISRVTQLLATLRMFPKPVIAAVHGHAVGGGAEIACEADLLLLSPAASLRLSDVTIGSSPATVFRLVRLVGLGVANRMTLLGAELKADEALMLGLALDVVDRDELLGRAIDVARRLAAFSPLALRSAKQALRLAQSADPFTDLAVNLEAEANCYRSPEMKEAVRRFLT